MSPQYFIGTSGWHYDHWRGVFYPAKLPKREWLQYYSRNFNTVEINNSFYRLPKETNFSTWQKSVPSNFCFAVKVSRFITHIKRLKESQEPLNTFSGRAALLKNSLGPLLFQLPANFHRDDERLESFLKLLDTKFLHVIEFRHVSWMDEAIYELLRRYRIAFCIFDMPGFTSPLVATSDFAYVRFHGHNDLYSSRYPDSALIDWAAKLRAVSPTLKALYIYFNNDTAGFAIENARTLRGFTEEK